MHYTRLVEGMKPFFAQLVRSGAVVLLVLSAALSGALAQSWLPAPSPLAQTPASPSLERSRLAATYPDSLEVKLVEGSGAELVAGALHSRTGTELAAIQHWFEQAAEVRPLVPSVSWDELDRWHQRALAVLPAKDRPGHLGLWFHVRAADAADAERLRVGLLAEPLVAHAYHAHVMHPAGLVPGSSATAAATAAVAAPMFTGGDLPPTTPSWTSQQLAHWPSPTGHGVRRAAGVLGGRGRGVGLMMIEDSWLWDHEDLCQVVQSNVLGTVPPVVQQFANHGIAGAGIAFGDRNRYGITGVADEVDAKFVWIDPVNGSFVNSVAISMQNGQQGDVFLCVVMILIPSLGPGAFLPFEFLQANYDAVRTATANGFHMVVPAGNGNRSLDDPALLGRFDRNFRDSGAIVVAASDAGALQKAPFSNWGSRIDAHSWGNQVITCGYGGLFFPNSDPLQAYTDAGTGTSTATPHIAGVVSSLLGATRRQTGQQLDNAAVLNLLHTIGPTTADVIGRRPDLDAMLRQTGAIDGLMVSEPDVDLGDTITVTMNGPPGGLAALFGSLTSVNLPIGFNRNIHLDPTQLSSLGAFVLVQGVAQYQLVVPNNVALHDLDIYFQAVRLDANQSLTLTSSCHVTVL
ncbi:MAG: S8 family serine peptidase [Planctomycetota bacterium]